MGRRINQHYIERYDRIVLTQPLAHNTEIRQIYDKTNKGWKLSYETTSIFHICPYDGVFRNCAECGGLDDDFDIEFCLNKTKYFTIGALNERVQDCLRAGLKVDFVNL